MLKRFLPTNRITIALVVIVMVIAVLLGVSATDMGSAHRFIQPIYQKFQQHQYLFIVWHVVLLLSIYLGLEYRVKQAIRRCQREVSPQKVKQVRWLMWSVLAFLVLVDMFVFWLK